MNNSPPSSSFHIHADSGPLAARELLSGVLDALKPMSLEAEELSTVEIVLAEALNNVVEHAYPEGGTPGLIDVYGDAKENGLHFRIEDSGEAMPDGHAPLGAQVDVDVGLMDMPEGGFGWFIIRDLAKDVEYAREGDKNVLNLRLSIAIPAS